MTLNKLWLTCLFALASGLLLADENKVQITTKTNNQGSELQLEARQVPLKQVLDKLMQETGVRIHYSALPTGLVTATCIGTTIKQLMEYLFDSKTDVIFRSRPESIRESTKELTRHDPQSQPEEVWILGTTMQPDQPPVLTGSENCTGVATQPKQIKTDNASKELTQAEPDEISKLEEIVRTGDATERADAVSQLAMAAGKHDANIRQALDNALSDGDANVRAQAVFGLARREGAGAVTALQAALQDKEPAVRLMAVDSAGGNAALLQQALTDSDETVRALAEIRLEALTHVGGSPR